MHKAHLALGIICASLLALPNSNADEPKSLKWTIKTLTIDGNEGLDIADFNKDGNLDIAAGRNWYAGPDFTPRPLRLIEDWNGYVVSNGDYAYDVDGDGWTDIIAGGFIPTEIHWYKNPGADKLRLGKIWEQKLLVDTKSSRNEGQLFQDLDGDGDPDWIVNSWVKNVPMHVWQMKKVPVYVEKKVDGKKVKVCIHKASLEKVVIGPKGNGHGMGVGDLNGDKKLDILVGQGWYENPGKDSLTGNWKLHMDWDIHASVPMIVRDLDGDGRNDVIVGQGHNYGLHWWRQLKPKDGKLQWEKILIDETFSQPHTLHTADLDGDGKEELITGKRYYAHNGGDPGGKEPPCLYYYTWDAKAKKFHRHVIDRGSVGTGLQIRTADLNGDGKMDIAVPGKSGTYVLINKGV